MAERAGEGPLSLLLEVQDLDVNLDQLNYRLRELEERRRVDTLTARIEALERRANELAPERKELALRQQTIDGQVESFTSRIAAIEDRLRQGGSGFREMEAMSAEAASLSRHRRALEDDELEVMEQLEQMDRELGVIEGERAVLLEERTQAAAKLADAEASLDAEIAVVSSARDERAKGLPSELAGTYERLRRRLGGVGAARLVDGACSGCHLRLPTGERERLLHSAPGEVVFCDQCGRILVG